MATETFFCSKCDNEYEETQFHAHNNNIQLCGMCNADFVQDATATALCGCVLCKVEFHCCYCGEKAENHCDQCKDHLCESCVSEHGHYEGDQLLCGGCYEAHLEEEEEYPDEGCCGRCGGDNHNGGTALWNDLCESCDRAEWGKQ